MTDQPQLPVIEFGPVICPTDPDIVTSLKQDYVDGLISLEEFEQRLDELAWI